MSAPVITMILLSRYPKMASGVLSVSVADPSLDEPLDEPDVLPDEEPLDVPPVDPPLPLPLEQPARSTSTAIIPDRFTPNLVLVRRKRCRW